MLEQYLTGANPRAKFRRIALAVLLAFCVISAGLHFTVGSIIAALMPERQIQADVPEHITILTFERRRDFPKVAQLEPQNKVALQFRQPQHLKPIRVVVEPRTFIVSKDLPKLRGSLAFRGVPKERHAGRTAVAQVSQRAGSGPSSPQTVLITTQGTSGEGSGEDVSYPGRQIPSGAVWSEEGPPGQSAPGGGVVLGGGGNRPVITIHDSCSPSRGNFIGSL